MAEKKNMYNELREMRQQIYSLPKENRDVAKGVLVYKKITTLERLDDMYAAGRSFINQYHKDWNEDKNAMKAIDKLKNILIKKMKTAFWGGNRAITGKSCSGTKAIAGTATNKYQVERSCNR
ncbi:relaxase [Escherichia coli]|nr:relaxase [Escherichia coli]